MRGDRNAPTFDPEKPRTLERYFDDLETHFARSGVTDETDKKKYAVKFVSIDVADLWEVLPEYEDPATTYNNFKAAILKLYPGTQSGKRYAKADLEHLVDRWQSRGIANLGEWSEYYREYLQISRYLVAQGKLAADEQKRLCIKGVSGESRQKLDARLAIVKSDVHPSDGYEVQDIHQAMEFILHGTSRNPPSKTESIPGQVTVKTEDLSNLLSTIAKAVANPPAQSAPAPYVHAPQASGSGTGAPNPFLCHYCDGEHRMSDCAVRAEDERIGRIKRNNEGRVILPGGGFVPRALPGKNMHERVIEWHRLNPGNLAKGTMSYAVAPAAQYMYDVVQPEPVAILNLSADDRIRVLEHEIYQIKARKAQFDGVEVPRRPPGIRPDQLRAEARIEDTTVEVSAPKKPEAAKSQKATVEDVPEHPFEKVADAAYQPPTQRNVGAAPDKKKEDAKKPAYKTAAPIEDPKLLDAVMEKLMRGTEITLTQEELWSISPDVRNKVREMVTAKRIPEKREVAIMLNGAMNPILPSVPELQALIKKGDKLPRGIIHVPDPYEEYLGSLPPGANPEILTVAKESHALRALHAIVDAKQVIECVIDPGSQVVSMSEAVCHKLGLQYDPTIILHMQSANGDVDRSLGLARNVTFQIGDLTLYLQVHVIREAAYDILLGRPFDVLTESVVRNYRNEDQTITLHCPNSGIVSTIPTIARGNPRFRMKDFQ